MSASAQAIWFFAALIGCLAAAFWTIPFGPTPADGRRWVGFHPGWLGLAAFMFVFFWIAVKAS
jgi:hypothetical protein